MSIRQWLDRIGEWTAITGPAATTPTSIAAPWSTAQLQTIALAELAGINLSSVPLSRERAMQVPAIVKGRALIAGHLSRLPLKLHAGPDARDTAVWMKRSRFGSPYARMLWTVDDMIFHGASLWILDRDQNGDVVDALRLPPSLWNVRQDLTIEIEGQEVTSTSGVCLIEGPQDGLLSAARATIGGALALESAWTDRVEKPIPAMELHNTDSQLSLTSAEALELVTEWDAVRKVGGTGYTPAGLELRVHGNVNHELFVEGRNALRLDIANFLNVPASLLEGSLATATLTYSTTEGRRNEFVDYTLRYWAAPIEARLSQDDIAGERLRVAFDFSSLEAMLPIPTTTED